MDPIYFRYFSSFIGNDPNIVPVDLSANVIEPILNPVQYRPYYADKNMFDKIAPNVSAKTLLRKSDGMYLTHDYLWIQNLSDSYLQELCSNCNRIVVKPAKETSGGKGIVIFERMDDGRFVSVFSYDKKEYALSVDFLNRLGDDIVVQEYLEQSPFFAQFNKESVNTIRMGVYRSVSSNEPIVLGSVLRIGRKGAYIDNACYGGAFVGENYIDVDLTFDDKSLSSQIKLANKKNARLFIVVGEDEMKNYVYQVKDLSQKTQMAVSYYDLVDYIMEKLSPSINDESEDFENDED